MGYVSVVIFANLCYTNFEYAKNIRTKKDGD